MCPHIYKLKFEILKLSKMAYGICIKNNRENEDYKSVGKGKLM